MLRRTVIMMSALMSFVLSLSTVAQENDINFARLDSVIQQEMEQQRVAGLAVAVVQEGAIVHMQGYGVRHRETQDPVTQNTLFRIGSTTKPLTAIALLQLVESGDIDLDAPIVNYVEEFTASPYITVRHVLSHSAGLRDNTGANASGNSQAPIEYVASLSSDDLLASPGTVFSYSNPGYSIVGLLIERVTEMPYAEYMAQHIFPVLNMDRTTVRLNVAATYPLAVGYDGLQVVRPLNISLIERPAAGAFSTVQNLANLARVILDEGQLYGEQIISPELIAMMTSPAAAVDLLDYEYGMGLIIRDYKGLQIIEHGGAVAGYTSFVTLVPELDMGVIVLSNHSGFDAQPIFDATLSLLDVPLQETLALPIELGENLLHQYEGEYLTTGLNNASAIAEIIIDREQGYLRVMLPDNPTLELRPLAIDLFAVYLNERPLNFHFAFQRNEQGRVAFALVGSAAPRAWVRIQ